MSKQYERLFRVASMRLPGALQDAMKYELFEVLNEFFSHSNAWRERIEFRTIADVDTYDILPFSGRIVSLIQVWDVSSVKEGSSDSNGFMVAATMPGDGVVKLHHAPTMPGRFEAEVSLTVKDPVTREGYPEAPPNLLERYHEALLDGLLSRMMSQPSKPYTNNQLATYHMRRFRGGMSRAKVDVMHGGLANAQRWRFPQTFNRRR